MNKIYYYNFFVSFIFVNQILAESPTCPNQSVCNEGLLINYTKNSNKECNLYLVPNIIDDEILSIYTLNSIPINTMIGQTELILPIIDANKNEHSLWHDYIWDSHIIPQQKNLLHNHKYSHDVLISGIISYMTCATIDSDIENAIDEDVIRYANVAINTVNLTKECSEGTDSNSVSCYNNFVIISIDNIEAGEELVLDCTDSFFTGNTLLHVNNNAATKPKQDEKFIASKEWVQKNGTCFDSLFVDKSSINGIGRGAYTKRNVNKDNVIIVSPTLHFDISQIDIVQQLYKSNKNDQKFEFHENNIEYNNTNVIDYQLILNYCFGNKNSNVLLLPFGPNVNFINHYKNMDNNDNDKNEQVQQPNAYIRWSNQFSNSENIRTNLPVMELYELNAITFIIEYVALRDIEAGEEIFIDYGIEWEENYKMYNNNNNYNNKRNTIFRKNIEVPYSLYPQNWMRYNKTINTKTDFISEPLQPGYMAQIFWSDNSRVVTPWAFRIGLNSNIRKTLLEYCYKSGVANVLSHVTKEGNSLLPATHEYIDINGNDWFLQRPKSKWRSNLHWVSPGGKDMHDSFLQTLSLAGFDDILKQIGVNLQLNSLVVFQVTFIAVSLSAKGFLHIDLGNTGHKAYNIIVPLLLANETEPELDLQCYDELRVGRYQYRYDEAILLGDDAGHGTAAVDYRHSKEMRLAATIYIADFNEQNVDAVSGYFTQAYPPTDNELLLSWAGRHWKKDDPTKSLPKPDLNHILMRPDISR